jgi:hypothetical protein
VEQTVYAVYGFAPEEIPVYNWSVSMDSKKAKDELPHLKTLIFYKVKQPYILYDYSYFKPTLSDPYSISKSKKVIVK